MSASARPPSSAIAAPSTAAPHGWQQQQHDASGIATAAAATTAAAAAGAGLPPGTALCVQCHTPQTRFYCADPCLTKRIAAHRTDIARLAAMRDRARAWVYAALGDAAAARLPRRFEPLSDPFGEPDDEAVAERNAASGSSNALNLPSPNPVAGHAARAAKARKAALLLEIEAAQLAISEARSCEAAGRESLHERSKALRQRRQALAKAKRILHGHDAHAGTRRSPGAWPERKAAAEAETADLAMSSPKAVRLRAEIESLQAKGAAVAAELASARAARAREALSIFAVSPPSASFANAGGLSSTSAAALARAQRSRERYMSGATAAAAPMPGAFDLRGRGASPAQTGIAAAASAALATASSAKSNDWTIVGLVLPVPDDIRRFPREAINGAVTHAAHLLHILSVYLGIQLPFAVTSALGTSTIRPHPLWSITSGRKVSLHLSSSAYGVLAAPAPGTSGGGGVAALGASTLSTLESFVQLPGGTHFSWGLASALYPNAGNASPQGGDSNGPRAGKPAAPAEDPARAAAREFCDALTMLAYNAAYLAHTQGMPVNVAMAAGSSLRLISRAAGSNELGKRAHTTQHSTAHIAHLSFPELDYGALHRAHSAEERSQTAEATRRSSSSRKAPKLLEESYVDAGQAAASILNVKAADAASAQVVTSGSAPTSSTTRPPEAHKAAAVARPDLKSSVLPARGPHPSAVAAAPADLSFLSAPKARPGKTPGSSNKASRAEAASASTRRSNAAAASAPTRGEARRSAVAQTAAGASSAGGVLFNGVVVGAGDLDGPDGSAPSTRRERLRNPDDEWHVL